MRFVTGKFNHCQLLEVLDKSIQSCTSVRAAIAYASEDNMRLFEACKKYNKSLEFYGRYDYSVPIHPKILKWFLDQKNSRFQCKLVPDILHAKIIWWEDAGVYIGSANHTDRGWFSNIETGMFLSDTEMIANGLDDELGIFFDSLDELSTCLTREVYDEQLKLFEARRAVRKQDDDNKNEFNKMRHIPAIKSILSVDKKRVVDKKYEVFHKEWDSTLEIMRNLAAKVALPEMLPDWAPANTAQGSLVDRFLHLYYHKKMKEGNYIPYESYYEQNCGNPHKAEDEIILWWKNGDYDHSYERKVIVDWAPKLKRLLSKDVLLSLDEGQFIEMGSCVHSIRDHGIKVEKELMGLPAGTKQGEEDAILSFLQWLWKQTSKAGKSPLETMHYVIWGNGLITKRLWDACNSEEWKIPHVKMSTYGELIGWANPETYPPRNKRTSKSLRGLGYNVKVNV